MDKIALGVVLFNPDNINRIKLSLDSLVEQNRKVYVFDNSTIQIDIPLPVGVKYISENKNTGIAHALNQLMIAAEKDGYQWLVTMDQDSILPRNTLKEYERYINDPKLGIICPQVIDTRRKYMEVKKFPEIEYIDDCITSASCTSISAWRNIGMFDEWLFIDLVDNEFCKRLVESNYKILRLNNLILNQQFGNIEPKSKPVQEFWCNLSKILKNKNIAKLSYKKNVSALRVYYTNRNIIYVNKKLNKYGKIAYSNYNCNSYLGFIFCFNVPSFLRSNKKIEVLKAIIKGTKDGLNSSPKEWKGKN